MLTKEQFQEKVRQGLRILDGATGSNLRAAGMPKGCCTEQWVLENPEPLVALQRPTPRPSQIIYAPPFSPAHCPEAVGLESTRKSNESCALTAPRPGADRGDLTTLPRFCDS